MKYIKSFFNKTEPKVDTYNNPSKEQLSVDDINTIEDLFLSCINDTNMKW